MRHILNPTAVRAPEHQRVTLPRGTYLQPQFYWQGDDAAWAAGVNGAKYPAAVLGVSQTLQTLQGWGNGLGEVVVDVPHAPANRGMVVTTDAHRYYAHHTYWADWADGVS